MTPYYADEWLTVYGGDCRTVLSTLPADSVDCVVTSPPYWGLRDYGTATWDGGDAACDHIVDSRPPIIGSSSTLGHPADGGPRRVAEGNNTHEAYTKQARGECPKCGAVRSDSQLGLEPTPEEYVANLVAVFAEVRRVLKPSGTCWLNLGDSYANTGKSGGGDQGKRWLEDGGAVTAGRDGEWKNFRPAPPGLKPKDLVGIPWRVAFALQADGWYLRSDIIWSKPNPMPESVTDRPTKSHEMVFLLTKSARYYFDSDAVREGVGESGVIQAANGNHKRLVLGQNFGLESSASNTAAVGVRLAAAVLDLSQRQDHLGLPSLDPQIWHEGSRDSASSGTVGDPIVRRAAAEAARFADGDVPAKEFLREMDRLCVALPDGHDLKELRAGARLPTPATVPLIDSDGDAAVAVNDAGEVGEVERIHHQEYTSPPTHRSAHMVGTSRNDGDRWRTVDGGVAPRGAGRNIRSVWTIASRPYAGAHFAVFPPELPERCIKAGSPEGGIILDPFAGSGTVGMVANRLSRRAILIDLNPEYLKQQMRRNAQTPLGLAEASA